MVAAKGEPIMSNNLAHFAINADDVSRARDFYENVFGWRFESWGPPDFFQISTGDDEGSIRGALQKRRELVPGAPMVGYECTIGVKDIDAIADAITSAGGKLVMEKTTIAGVGHLIFFQDSEGNVVGAMQYDFDAE